MQIVFIMELAVTALAVVLVVSLRFHVLLGGLLSVESLLASTAWKLRRPVIGFVHMLVGCILGVEDLPTRLAGKFLGPVSARVHVLVASTLG